VCCTLACLLWLYPSLRTGISNHGCRLEVSREALGFRDHSPGSLALAKSASWVYISDIFGTSESVVRNFNCSGVTIGPACIVHFAESLAIVVAVLGCRKTLQLS
jgi:hypothetical protein